MLAAVAAAVSARLLPFEAKLLPGTDSGCLFALHRGIASSFLPGNFCPDPPEHWVKDELGWASSSARDPQDRGAVHGLLRRVSRSADWVRPRHVLVHDYFDGYDAVVPTPVRVFLPSPAQERERVLDEDGEA